MGAGKKAMIVLAALGFIIPMMTAAEEGPSSAEEWYRESYAPLWASEAWDSVDAIVGHFAATVLLHSADGEASDIDSNAWLNQAMVGWRAEGWVGSDLASLLTREQAPSRVVFDARWLDRYREGESEYSCGSYVVELKDDSWQITEYGESECPAQHVD